MVCFVNTEILYFSVLASSILSAIGSLLMILAYIFLPTVRVYSMRLVFYIAVSDFFRAVCFMIPCNYISDTVFVGIIAYIMNCTTIISCVWAVAISCTLYKIVAKNKQHFDKDHMFWIFVTFIFLVLNVLPLVFENFTSISTVCTFKDSEDENYWKLFTIYAPIWVFILLSIYFYSLSYVKIRDLELTCCQKCIMRRLFIFPLLTIIAYLPYSLLRASEMFLDNCNLSNYFIFSINLFCLHGIFSSAAYFWGFGISQDLKNYYEKIDNKKINNTFSSRGTNLLYLSFISNDSNKANT
ncbi:hypothetical protein SteCoe_16228 [Stentor coeruleus]|uniref:G-protein coupled receptors family 2 profile 2 domain-containing protein n=1 Tax=Stentor coeruleus TaxID=5963 RepID=A0A1R2C1P5_9CILI|nr:hypothetical protein SteCoe_16228 [Stentor coeruleus]